jgi:hypothetical protein
MNVQGQQSSDAASAHAYRERRDAVCCVIVDHGIAVQAHSNSVCALEYLKSQNISPDVIARVLLEPHRRRTVQ